MARQQREPQGPPPPPAVQKLRIRYAKRGRLRFSSTRDFQRALERALRRAQMPIAFSAGFHPHPKISYANAASTGTASEAEYVEVSLTERRDPDVVRALLDEALPVGLDVVTVVEAPTGALADLLQASDWVVAFRGLQPADLHDAVARFLAEERVDVTRMLKTGPRTFDTRAAVVTAYVTDRDSQPGLVALVPGECAILRMVVRHTTPAVRPDDILTALRAVAGLEPPTPPLVIRLAQGPLRGDSTTVADPLAVAEETVGD